MTQTRRILHAHSDDVTLQGELGKGTMFAIRLSTEPPQQTEAGKRP
jgi:hypothetical protein